MNAALQRLLDAHCGVVAWSAACRELTRGTVEWAVRTGAVLRPYSGVIVDPAGWDQAETRWRAALVVAGPSAVLSHLTALAVWRLPVPEAGEVRAGAKDPGSGDRGAPRGRILAGVTGCAAASPLRRWSGR
ncbi:MAG TPA: hypothetical protein VK028_15065 [Micromonosporaceae bacterium]|nr:hypothetical protein [Micromonosporaceae bacterium]